MKRRCNKCRQEKPDDQFYNTCYGARSSVCKTCTLARTKARQKKKNDEMIDWINKYL